MSVKKIAVARLVVVSLAAGLLLAAVSVSGTALAAGGGNAANAKMCQKDGWQALVTSAGKSFANEEACASYAARGGTLLPASEATCLNGGWEAPAQRSDGTSFGSEADCVAYASGNGVVYKPSLKALPPVVGEEQNIAVVASGFHPNSTGAWTIVTLPMMTPSTLVAVTNGTGGFTGSSVFTAGACALGVTGAQFTYVDGSGVHASASATLDCA
jgi:hypothetical protein